MIPLRRYGIKTKVGLTRDKTVRSNNPFMSKEAPGGGKSRQQKQKNGGKKIDKRKTTQKHRTDCSLAITTFILASVSSTFLFTLSFPVPLLLRVPSVYRLVCKQRFSRSAYPAFVCLLFLGFSS